MNKSVIVLVVIIAVVAGTFIITNQNKKAAQLKQAQLKAVEKENRLAAEAQKAIDEAKKIEEIAKQKAEALRKQIATNVLKAKSLLDAGQFQQAIDIAKNVLSQNAGNTEAKMILEEAMTKLKKIAQQKIDALAKQEAQKMVEESDLIPSVPSVPGSGQ